MVSTIDKLNASACSTDDKHKVCRSRGGESCAFDGAMIVLQPIADTAHIVHGPIACCGNTWEGRGTESSKGVLHTMGFTTDLGEIDIVYGSEEKLLNAIKRTNEAIKPKAIFVYSTCVSGLTGEDIDAVCKRAENVLGVRVIPVNAPGFAGPKNLGNRIAGEVLLEHVIGSGESPVTTHTDINLIGEYNIAGDLWLVEPLLAKAGIRVLSRITGDSTFEEITWAHQAKLNVVVCSRALINVAREMERKYGIPYVEVSFFGSTETGKALRAIAGKLQKPVAGSQESGDHGISESVERLIKGEEKKLKEMLKPFRNLRSKKAVLYTGGVKSWSFISALRDLGIELVAVGTKKSTIEDEEKMKELLGPDAPLIEDVSPKNLLKILQERNADILVAGGRNQYLAIKEGYPFADVNQERHIPYAGYPGLVNLAEQITNSIAFYERGKGQGARGKKIEEAHPKQKKENVKLKHDVLINPLKHSPSIGAAIALQGIDQALPIIHGAQGCTFLGKVLLTKHFREPIALAASKLFVEDVVMGSEDKLIKTIEGFAEKNNPALIGVLTSGLSEVKGDDVATAVKRVKGQGSGVKVIHIPTPDYDGGLETGYARAVEAVIGIVESGLRNAESNSINVIVGSHLTPGDVTELREIMEAFGLRPIILPDLSALDGSRQVFSPLAAGGTTVEDLSSMAEASFTIGLGMSMEPAAKLLQQKFGAPYRMFDSVAGLADSDQLMQTLAEVSGKPVPAKYQRQRKVLKDAMRDAHFFFGGKRICLALEPDLAIQTSKWLEEMGATIDLVVIPTLSDAADRIRAQEVRIGDFYSIEGEYDVLISSSHGESTAKRLKASLYEMGFPVYKRFGYTAKVMIGYQGTLTMINEMANLLMKRHA
ncbi:MAG: nitrogenase iron-molybdenum cofactor biosynthesis protein NifE [Nitrospiraceae bacterium]|nr:nitrogenase iron-molybdenum cofactor biosynthesis protein NifE [Nitrospiraceae bacterium]